LEFFRFDTHTHFVAFVVYFAGLFESRTDTVNLKALVNEANASETFPGRTITRAQELLTHARRLSRKITILRSNLFAHRSASLSYSDAFRRASVTPDELYELTEVGLEVINLLLTVDGSREQVFHQLPRGDAEKLLDTLVKHPVER
jgi:hypothetical protein